MTFASRLAAALVLVAPVAGHALEPRYDHREQDGLLLSLELFRDSVSAPGRPSVLDVHPRLRAGWSFDVTGDGDELVFGGALRASRAGDPERLRYLGGLDARYRAYFGSEELKTFFEVGLWAELARTLAAGPQVSVGLTYDPDRNWGFFTSLGFGTAFGEARVASLGASLGVQYRFD